MDRGALTRLTAVVVMAAVGSVARAPLVAAHDDVGAMTVTATDAGDGTTIRLDVGLVYSSDGHHAGAATVTATATGPTGTVGPVPVPHVSGESRYAVDLTVPAAGDWAVSVTSTEPDAEGTAAVVVAPPAVATTTIATTTTELAAPEPTTTEPGSDEATTSEVGVAVESEPEGGRVATVAAIAVGGAALMAIAGVVIARGRREQP